MTKAKYIFLDDPRSIIHPARSLVVNVENSNELYSLTQSTKTIQPSPPLPNTHISSVVFPSCKEGREKYTHGGLCDEEGGRNAQIFFRPYTLNRKVFSVLLLFKITPSTRPLPLKRNRRALSTHHFKAPQLEQTKSLTPAVSFPQTQHDLTLHTQSFVEFHMAEPCKIGLSNRILFRDRSSSKKSCRH
jgi:hypothetical protein